MKLTLSTSGLVRVSYSPKRIDIGCLPVTQCAALENSNHKLKKICIFFSFRKFYFTRDNVFVTD